MNQLIERKAAWLIFAAALAVRLVYVAQCGPDCTQRVADALDYHSYAVSILDHARYEDRIGERAGRMPGYPLFLSAVYSIYGRGTLAIQLIQCLLGAGTCVFVFLIAGRWLNARWAWTAGLAAALYYDLFAPCGPLLTEALSTFLVSWSFWLWNRRPPLTPTAAAVACIPVSAAYLVRPEFGPFMVVLAVLAALIATKNKVKTALAVIAVLAATLVPWTARNWLVLGRPIATTTAGAINLYIGLPRTIAERFGGLQGRYLPLPESNRLITGGEIERMDGYKAAAMELHRQASSIELIKAWLFNVAIQFYPFLPQYDATLVLLMPFWLWGAWAARKEKGAWPVIACAFYLIAVYSVVAVMQARHRQTAACTVILLAVFGLKDIYSRVGRRRFAWLAGGWAFLDAGIWAFSPALRQWLLAALKG